MRSGRVTDVSELSSGTLNGAEAEAEAGAGGDKRGIGIRELEERGAIRDGGKGLRAGIVLRLRRLFSGFANVASEIEMMLNRSLYRQAGSFFLLYGHNGQPRHPGSLTLFRKQ